MDDKDVHVVSEMLYYLWEDQPGRTLSQALRDKFKEAEKALMRLEYRVEEFQDAGRQQAS